MSLAGASMELNNALKAAREVWDDAQVVWKDAVCRAFEQEHWEPLAQQIESTLQAMEQLNSALVRAMHECS
jgi:hypothetical protein